MVPPDAERAPALRVHAAARRQAFVVRAVSGSGAAAKRPPPAASTRLCFVLHGAKTDEPAGAGWRAGDHILRDGPSLVFSRVCHTLAQPVRVRGEHVEGCTGLVQSVAVQVNK